MKHTELKELIRQVVKEESDYQQLFKHMLDRTGKSIPDMSDAEKVKFFTAVDKASKAKSEGKLTGYNEAELSAGQKKIDVDGDGEIEGKKTVDEYFDMFLHTYETYKIMHPEAEIELLTLPNTVKLGN